MSHTKEEVYLIFFLAHWLKTNYFKKKGKITIAEMESLAKEINENPKFLDNEKDRGISYRVIDRLLKFQEFKPKNLDSGKLNKITRFMMNNTIADFRSVAFRNNISEEVKSFKRTHVSMLQDFFEMFKSCKLNTLNKEDEERYNFNVEQVNEIIRKHKKTENGKDDNNKLEKIEMLIESLERKIDVLSEKGIKSVLSEKQIQELGGYLNIWSEEKLESIYRDTLHNELSIQHQKLEKAIRLNRYLGGLGLLFIGVDNSQGFSDALFKKFEKQLSRVFSEEYSDEILIMSGDQKEGEDDANNDDSDPLKEN
ncbi:hypothetical protein [Ascidiimonas sp. W6]|uniref:hypothetical protein n=1 Tax=Ascidiimonas meishanensis TaxID=3128903 RepID=UPI0030EF9A79